MSTNSYQQMLVAANSHECLDMDDHVIHPWNHEWTDITKEFFGACRGLELGELVKDERFHLAEAMSAIELMDPKMDVGMVKMGRTLGFDESVKSGILRVDSMPTDELIATIDATWAGVVTWFEGHSLAQTIFTNLCLHKPNAIGDKTLHAFSMSITKLVSICRLTIHTAAVYEEEDFNAVGFDTCIAPLNQVTSWLKSAEDELQKSSRKQKNDESHQIFDRIADRIRFVRYLLLAIASFVSCDYETAAAKFKPNMDEANKHLKLCEQLLQNVIDSVDLGLQPIDGNDGDFGWLPAFNPTINRRLLPPTFPRKTQLYTRLNAFDYLLRFVRRLQSIASVLPQKIANIDATLTFMRNFSQDSSCILSRSILQLAYLPDDDRVMGITPLHDIIVDTIRDFTSPPILHPRQLDLLNYTVENGYNNFRLKSMTLYPFSTVPNVCGRVFSCTLLSENEQCALIWLEFVNDCAKVFLALVQNCGHNRARQRERLVPSLEDLSALQAEADRIDAELHAHLRQIEPNRQHLQVLSTFVLYHTLHVMREYFLLSFELQLYANYEFPYIYWYMGEMVYKWLANVLDRAQNTVVREYQSSWKEKSKSDRKKNYKQKKESEMRKRIVIGQERFIFWQANLKMSDAMFKMSIGLFAANKLKLPIGSGESIRYDSRMLAFACLTAPPPIRYEQYFRMSRIEAYVKMGPTKCLQDAADAFDAARSHLEHLENVADYQLQATALAKVCKHNAIVVRLLASGHRANSTTAPTFDFSCSVLYPLLKL